MKIKLFSVVLVAVALLGAEQVEDLGRDGIGLVVEAQQEQVDPARDFYVTVTATAPAGRQVVLPDLRERFQGFQVAEDFTEEPTTDAAGVVTTVSRWRLVPEPLARKYRLAPFVVTVLSGAGEAQETTTFYTRPVRFAAPAAREPVSGEMEIDPKRDFPPLTWKLVGMIMAGVLGVVGFVALVYLVIRKIRLMVKIHRMSPIERALYELDQLLKKGLPGRGFYKDFYVELTMVVRRYIERRHAVRAPNLTTEEFLRAAQENAAFSTKAIAELKQFLESADLVKFAGVQASPEMADSATGKARDYLRTDAETPTTSTTKVLLVCCVVACAVTSSAATTPKEEKPLDFTGAFPPSIKTIGLVMPASIQPRQNFERGVAALEAAGYKVKRAKRLNFKTRASVEDRVADFEEVWMDPEVDLVLCARGGTGAQDLLEKIDWVKLRTRPQQRVLGFSNITMLLNAMLKEKVGVPFSGPSLSHFLYADPKTFKWLAPALDRGPLPDVQLKSLRPGACRGTAVGGHIMLVSRAVGMGWAPDSKGKIVFLESSANYPPSIRSALNGLIKRGYFKECAGVVFGDITPSGRKLKRLSGAALEEGRAAVAQIKKDFAAQVTCPVWDDYPYGHVPVSYAIDHLREKTITEDGVLKQ